DTASGPGHESGGNTLSFQYIYHSIDCVSLADTARVELHALPVEPHRPGSPVEVDMPVPRFRQGGLHHGAMRQATRSLIESPDLHQRPDRDVERPFALAAILQASGKDLEQLGRDLHRSLGGALVYLA